MLKNSMVPLKLKPIDRAYKLYCEANISIIVLHVAMQITILVITAIDRIDYNSKLI